jgi:hypothetical protein
MDIAIWRRRTEGYLVRQPIYLDYFTRTISIYWYSVLTSQTSKLFSDHVHAESVC